MSEKSEIMEEQQGTGQEEVQEQQETTVEELEKKYTDEDIERIIKRRLAQERRRFERLTQNEGNEYLTELVEREQKILQRELRADAKEYMIDNDVPCEALDLLNYSSEEDYKKSLESIEKLMGVIRYKADTIRNTGITPKVVHGKDPTRDIKGAFAPPKAY